VYVIRKRVADLPTRFRRDRFARLRWFRRSIGVALAPLKQSHGCSIPCLMEAVLRRIDDRKAPRRGRVRLEGRRVRQVDERVRAGERTGQACSGENVDFGRARRDDDVVSLIR
jgi:hypothetical protein